MDVCEEIWLHIKKNLFDTISIWHFEDKTPKKNLFPDRGAYYTRKAGECIGWNVVHKTRNKVQLSE